MKRRAGILLSSIAVVVLFTGSRQVYSFVGRLSVGDWNLGQRDGELCLLKSTDKAALPAGVELYSTWSLNAPMVKAVLNDRRGDNTFSLAVEETADGPKLKLIDKPAPSTSNSTTNTAGAKDDTTAEWTFDIISRIEPKFEKLDRQGPFKVGNSGYIFRLRVASGKYKGWYLAAEDEVEAQTRRVYRKLRLEKEEEKAIQLQYIAVRFGIG